MTAIAPITGPALVSELQHELGRVGCYGGPVNGAWTSQTRKAMAAFVEQANAKLPTNDADPVLFALVRHHAGLACGGSCPAGQEASSERPCRRYPGLQRLSWLHPGKLRSESPMLPVPTHRSRRDAHITVDLSRVGWALVHPS